MTGPEDPAAAGRDRLSAGHADREQLIETLKDAFVHGRLTRDELDVRAGRALAAQTRAYLAMLTADIQAGPAVAAAWPSLSPPCGSPPTSSIRMASAIPIIPGVACAFSWPFSAHGVPAAVAMPAEQLGGAGVSQD